MAKEAKTIYTCSECGGTSLRWLGKCPSCNAWNTLEEGVAESSAASRHRFQALAKASAVTTLADIDAADVARSPTGHEGRAHKEHARVWKRGGQLEDLPSAIDIHAPRLLERAREHDVGGAVNDERRGANPAPNRTRVQSEARSSDVAADGRDARGSGAER